jgi:ATP-dependent helicase/nuclease subunit A
LLSLPPDHAAPDAPAPLVWAGGKANDVGPMATARETALDGARDEYRRLLYVAMTRAIDRLIVCGVDGSTKRPEGCWYDLVKDALGPGSLQEPADDGGSDVLRYRKSQDGAASTESKAEAARVVEVAVLPDWLQADAKPEDERGKAITPSGFASESAPVDTTDRGDARQRALRRGNIVHRLMQSLPDVAPDRRGDAARGYLARQMELTRAERDEIASEVLGILADPSFAELFSPGGRSEVSIAGRRGDRPLSGQIDRLVVSPQAVLIADYKTGPAPRNLDEAQTGYGSYVAQLALYREVLMRIYPDRPVRAALVWTETPELMEIPSAVLDTALGALTPL